MSTEPPEAPAGEDVTRGRRYLKPGTRLVLAGTVSAAVFGLIVYEMLPAPQRGPLTQNFQHSGGRPWVMPAINVSFRTPSPLPPPPSPPAAKVTLPPPTPAEAPSAAPMGFYQTESASSGVAQAAQQRANPVIPVSAASTPDPQAAGADPTQGRVGVARAIVGKPFDLHYLLKRNTVFHCVPDQPLNSSVPGPIGCTVAEDVYSADGSVVLIEKGSSVEGDVVSGPALGADRMFVNFDEVLTTSGIPIYLSGTGGDTLGTSGVPGYVDDHLWRKIRAAVLLSMVEIAGQVAENEAQPSGTINFSAGTGQGQSLAQMALAHDIDIPPTLVRNQADPLTVTVRQDIPMESAYRLVAASNTP